MEVFRKYSLKHYNTFGIEVFAEEFVNIQSDDELLDFFTSNAAKHGETFILGGGSNILLTGDVAAMVVKISTHGRVVVGEDDETIRLRVSAGEDWDGLVAFCVAHGWGGLENLSGIPGQVGSSPIQNIGAYGTELKDHFVGLEAINRFTGESVLFNEDQCRFGYRDSIFKRELKDRMIVTHVTFHLQKQPVFNLTYRALQQKLEHFDLCDLNLHMIRDAVLEIRASKLPDPKVLGNAGSFFKNPVVSREVLAGLKEKFPEIVYFENSQDTIGSSQFAVGSSLNGNESFTNRELQTANRELRTANCEPRTAS